MTDYETRFVATDAARLVVPPSVRQQLERWTRSSAIDRRLAVRARIVLLVASGRSDRQVARELDVSVRTVCLWRRRYEDGGLDAMARDKPGRGRKPGRDPALVARVRELMTTARPDGARWTSRSLAAALGMSHSTVHRILQRDVAPRASDDAPPGA
jgi:transposase